MRALLALVATLAAAPAQIPARGQAPLTLSASGIAVQTGRSVILTDPAGHEEATLAGYTLRNLGVERIGQVELRDRAGRDWELRSGRLVRVPQNSITLVGGWTLTFATEWLLHREGVSIRYPSGTKLALDASATLLSVRRPDGGPTYVRDLRSGKVSTLPAGCRVGARVGKTDYELCGTSIVRVDPSGRHPLSGAAQARGAWQELLPGPFGAPLLAQWLGQCGVQTAYLVDRTRGRRTQLTDKHGRHVESRSLGWVGTASFAWLPPASCGLSASPPGVYTYDASGRPLLVYRLPDPKSLVQLWG